MTWRDAIPDWMRASTNLSREEWLLVWAAWFVTLVAYPFITYGRGFLVGIGYGLLIGLWIGGAYYQLQERGYIPVIGHE